MIHSNVGRQHPQWTLFFATGVNLHFMTLSRREETTDNTTTVGMKKTTDISTFPPRFIGGVHAHNGALVGL